MNSDCFFTGTRQHHICQDYALSVMKPFPFVMIGDGCSSSPNTDIGARVLLQHFKKEVLRHVRDDDFDISVFEHCKETIDRLGLEQESLDATLIICKVNDDLVDVKIFGDGNLIFCYGNDETYHYELKYSNNAPFYLSYYFDIDRQNQYIASLTSVSIKSEKLYFNNKIEEEIKYFNDAFDYTFTIRDHQYKNLKYVCIASDGLSSFFNKSTGENIPIDRVVKDVIAFKNHTGEFVKRRMYKLMKDYEKEGIVNYDDVSVAAIYCGE